MLGDLREVGGENGEVDIVICVIDMYVICMYMYIFLKIN